MGSEGDGEDQWAVRHNFTESTVAAPTAASSDAVAIAEVAAAESALRQLHLAALDEVVSVNSFFTAAVFIGLSLNATQQTSLVTSCEAGPSVARNLVVHEVVAFSCYLFSTLIAQGLKLQMTLSTISESKRKGGLKQSNNIVHIDIGRLLSPRLLRLGMILSALGSIVGTVFLMLSMVSVIQIRLGLLSCNSPLAIRATLPLITLVSIGVLSFISPVLYAVIST